ncbi:hypothetical protein Tco_0325471 [Tanacetum coccineum]
MTWRTTQWEWSADVILEKSVVYLIGQKLVTFLHLILEMNYVRMEGFDNFICRTFQVFRCELCDSLLLAEPINKHSNITGRLNEGMDQAGSGVAVLIQINSGNVLPISSSSDTIS